MNKAMNSAMNRAMNKALNRAMTRAMKNKEKGNVPLHGGAQDTLVLVTKILNLAAHYDSIFSLDNKGSHCCWKFSLAISHALKDCIILQASQPFIKDFPRENQFAAVITIMQTDLFLSDEQTTNFKLNVRLSFVVNWSIDQNQLHHMSL